MGILISGQEDSPQEISAERITRYHPRRFGLCSIARLLCCLCLGKWWISCSHERDLPFVREGGQAWKAFRVVAGDIFLLGDPRILALHQAKEG